MKFLKNKIMKKQLLILFTLFLTSYTLLKAQEPDFKFHLAFEDATGAKDTVWFIWDSTATNGYDIALGEMPISLTPNVFQVYFQLGLNDTGKVRAKPMNNTLSGASIEAQNYVYPIILRWDSSLFSNNNLPFIINQAYLDNEWFFLNNNWGANHLFNMLVTDSVDLPKFYYGSEEQFPMSFSFGYDPSLNTSIKYNLKNKLSIYPNPVNDYLQIKILKEKTPYTIQFFDLKGSCVMQQAIKDNNNKINIELLPKGVYFLKIFNEKSSTIQKIIKI
jgi:hypothetical protein